MDKTTCPKCGADIPEGDINFCPKCGANLFETVEETWTCKNCGTENSADALFCVSCGESREKQNKLFYSQKFRFGILLILVVLIGGFGSYFYFSGINEDKYLTYYTAAARDVQNVDNTIGNHLKVATIKSTKPENLINQLNAQKKILNSQLEIFSQIKPFKNYEMKHNAVINILQKEISAVDSAIQLISNPLDTTTDNTLESMRKNLESVKNLSAQIQISQVNFFPTEDLLTAPDQLNIFISEQKKTQSEKMEKLAANQEFFRQMDELINRYNAAANDLWKMLETTRKSDMTWNDYFNMLDRAKSDRTSIRYTVSEIKPVAEMNYLKEEFMSVLDEAIRYCEMMRAAANLGFNNYSVQRYMKEGESREVNTQVQENYDAFIQRYESEKARLTNINNL